MSDQNQDQLYAMRHSLAHIMASAIQHLWPEVKLGVGPVVENGFYYDVDLGDEQLSADDFVRIEAEMQKIIKASEPFERFEMPVLEAIDWARKYNQPYKEELLNDLQRDGTTVAKDLDSATLGLSTDGESKVEHVSFYRNGDFTDLCRGPHVEATNKVGTFKLMRIAGAYWRGKEGNPQMQRIYGVAFATPKELRSHLDMLEEAKKRDHRKLGQELDLFYQSSLVGAGLPLFTPRGVVLREAINELVQSYRLRDGYERVWTPNIGRLELYKVSGHFEKFPELLHFTSQESGDDLALKPVNCPHHSQIYASLPRSYRELPIKYLETTTVYRDERKGELGGLSRVRAITQDDSHVFCTDEQVGDVFAGLIQSAKELYELLDMKLSLRLSFRDDGDGYIGDVALWERAQSSIQAMAEKFEMDYTVGEGEAAMYGPKMDFMAHDALGREWQLATVQLDYALPERFKLEYVAESGEMQRPVMVHCALIGSIERFLSVYIEHTAGRFPVWVAPEQIRFISVNQESDTITFVDNIVRHARELGLRVSVDNSNESVGKKIRAAEIWKVPYTLVLGEKEIGGGELMPRIRKDLVVNEDATKSYTVDEFLKTVAHEAKSRVSKTSL
jgi:threonyl-tRNA synthetase